MKNQETKSCCGETKKIEKPSCCSKSVCHPADKPQPYYSNIKETPVGQVPGVKTELSMRDRLGALRVRLGILRDQYRVTPGLYSVGAPRDDSPVFVSANFKLSFDALRSVLTGLDAWILVIDTKGINVWCAAGKGTFGTDEIVKRVRDVKLDGLIKHRALIVPQLGAPGVSAHEVKKQTGFRVSWGPIRAKDIPQFLHQDRICDESQREVTFTLKERFELIPVEIKMALFPALIIILLGFVVSGISHEIFSLDLAVKRGVLIVFSLFMGMLGGAVLTPLLLFWLPGRAFAVKGVLVGLILSGSMALALWPRVSVLEITAMAVFLTTISSFLAMNFTGTSPYTSPSGVEKEMRHAIPAQALGLVLSLVLWIWKGVA